MRIFRLGSILVCTCLWLTSCEKKEIPVTLPGKGDAKIDRVDMGEDYEDQVFYDLEKGVVLISKVNSWDLAFEASEKGYHVIMNGGKDIWIHNTGSTDIKSVLAPPNIKNKDWSFDSPSGLPDSTAIGEWAPNRISKNEVFIVKLNPAHFKDTFKKIQLVSYNADEYRMLYSDLRSTEIRSITIPKNLNFNFSYFSFDGEGSVVHPEPTKHSWDIVFTRYRHIYYDLQNFPYIVTGVLSNPNRTRVAVDSISGYDEIAIEDVLSANFKTDRDAMGFLWKSYDIPAGLYTTKKNMVYMINNRNGQFWKLHFLDFYNSSGVKGSPTFKFERMQ